MKLLYVMMLMFMFCLPWRGSRLCFVSLGEDLISRSYLHLVFSSLQILVLLYPFVYFPGLMLMVYGRPFLG